MVVSFFFAHLKAKGTRGTTLNRLLYLLDAAQGLRTVLYPSKAYEDAIVPFRRRGDP